MTVRQVFENVIQTLMIEKGDNSPDFIRTRVIDDLNAAVQTMTTGLDYFTAEEIPLQISAGSPTADLPEDTLNIHGQPMLGDGSPLTRIATAGEFNQYAQIFLGYKNNAPAGRPSGIFFDTGNRPGSANSVKTTVRFCPAPDVAHTVKILISRRPTKYTVADLSGSSPEIPMPAKNAESILLPIVRWNVRTSHFFNSPNMLPSMEQEYQAALVQLGLSAPEEDAINASAIDRKKNAARAAAREAYANTQ